MNDMKHSIIQSTISPRELVTNAFSSLDGDEFLQNGSENVIELKLKRARRNFINPNPIFLSAFNLSERLTKTRKNELLLQFYVYRLHGLPLALNQLLF